MRMIKTAIITGATGAIGQALCRLLVKENVRVYAFVRPESPGNESLRDIPGLELIDCPLSKLGDLPKDTTDLSADAFFHLAWAKTTGAGRDDMSAQIANIRYTLDAVHASMVFGCSVFIGAGSQAEYGRVNVPLTPDVPCFPENGYGMAKLCAGQMSRIECEKLGIDHIWTRILSVYGPHDGMGSMIMSTIEKLLKNEKPVLTAGDQIWDYIYSEDIADALYKMALYGKAGAIYPVGYGNARPLREYIEIIRNAIDPSLPLGFGEIPYGPKQVMYLRADNSELTKDTGFTPKTDFRTGIQKTIEYVRETFDR